MPKGLCIDGVFIDQKVKIFQTSRKNQDYLMVEQYYDDFKDHWFKKVEDLIDREEFDREWYNKLLHSMETYREDKALHLCRIKGWSLNNKFNRWFYSALRNWICNVKTQAFRTNKRPGIVCPICFREVSKIEERHLEHVKTTSDLPKAFMYNNMVCKTYLFPKKEAKYYMADLQEVLNNCKVKTRSMAWPWFLNDGQPGVMCPYTSNIVAAITNLYLTTLPKKYRHYAKPYTWYGFQEEFPNFMVHSEVMSLDYSSLVDNDNRVMVDNVGVNRRLDGGACSPYICDFSVLAKVNNSTPVNYEYALKAVEKYVDDIIDRNILKYVMIGYEIKDVCDELGISRKEIKNRIDQLQENKILQTVLTNGII